MATTPFPLENGAQLWNMSIDSSGRLLVNANSTSAGEARLRVNDDGGGLVVFNTNDNTFAIELQNAANTTFRTGMYVTDDGFFRITNQISQSPRRYAQLNSTGSWTIESDRQVKRDIEQASSLLDKAMALNPVRFFYNNQDLAAQPHKLTGFIADEVEAVLPHLVDQGPTKFLDYSGLIPVAIGALQELKRTYDEQIAALRAQVAELTRATAST